MYKETFDFSPDNTAEEGSIFYFSHGEEPPIVAKDTEKATMKIQFSAKSGATLWMGGWVISKISLILYADKTCHQNKDVFFGDNELSFHQFTNRK